MSEHEHVVDAFLEALAVDRAAGRYRPCAEYVARWPRHEDAVASAFRAATPPEEDAVANTDDETDAAGARAAASAVSSDVSLVRFGDYDL